MNKRFCFFSPQKFLRTIEYHPNNYIIEYLGHSWGTPLKNCLDAVFNKGLIRHLIIWKTLHFKALTWLWLSKLKGPALPKESWRKGFCFFLIPKVVVHNRVPCKQLYILLSIWATHRVPPWKIVWMLFFFNNGLIRHLIIWKTLRFKALTWIWFSKVNWIWKKKTSKKLKKRKKIWETNLPIEFPPYLF